jgi:hypothetical protein
MANRIRNMPFGAATQQNQNHAPLAAWLFGQSNIAIATPDRLQAIQMQNHHGQNRGRCG